MLKSFLNFLFWIIVLGLSIFSLLMSVTKSHFVLSPVAITGIIFVVSVVALISYSSSNTKKTVSKTEKKVVIGEGADKIELSSGSVIQMIENSLLKIESVKFHNESFKYQDKEGFIFKINVTLKSGENVNETIAKIKETVVADFKLALNVQVETVEVSVNGFVSEKSKG